MKMTNASVIHSEESSRGTHDGEVTVISLGNARDDTERRQDYMGED